jgi:hypothetical protein
MPIMNAYPRLFAALALAAAAGLSSAADVGRVVLAAGETTALRQGQVVRLSLGTMVQDADTLRTGTASNLQVRFEDDSYISMRENSELRVQEFRFSGKADGSERAIFDLVKGGMRAITGLIGRANHDNYRMTTPTSTIGIRGTDYASTVCLQSECRNEDGTPARPGTYGRVIGQSHGTNQIEVSNDADRRTLGINSNFYVGDRKSTIELLLVAPEFVLSKLEGRNRGGSKGSAGGTGDEQATSGGASEESRPSTTPEPLPPLQFVVTQQLDAQGGSAVVAPTPNGFVVAYPLPNTNPNFGEFFFDDGFLTGTYNGLGQLTAYGTAGTFPSGSLNGGTITDTGSIVLTNGQVLTYGRWTGNTSTVLSDGSTFVGAPVLFGTANDVQNMASVVGTLGGVATYNYAGGPKPVDAGGNVGSITSTSNTINFTTQTQQLSLAMNFPSVLVSGANTGSAAFNLSTVFSQATSQSGPGTGQGEFFGALSGSCVGSGCLSSSAVGLFGTGLTGTNGYEASVVAGVVSGTQAGDVAFLNAYTLNSFTAGPPPAPPVTGQVAWANGGALPVANTASLNTSQVTLSGNNLVAFGDGVTFPSGMLNSGSIVETGSTPLVDGSTMNWGRWTGAGVQVISSPGNVAINPSTGVPFVLGSANTVLPTSGSFLYSFAGGPNPVNTSGNIGSFTGGAFNVSFGSTSGSMTVASPLTLSVGGVGYTLNSCSSGCTFANSPAIAGNMVLTGTCIGGACSTSGPATANAAGIFVGPQGAGLAVAGNVTSLAPTVTFGAAFKR